MAMSTVTGSGRVVAKLKYKSTRQPKLVAYAVSYEAPYAVQVHENLQMKLMGQPRPSGLGRFWYTKDAQPGTSKYLQKAIDKAMQNMYRTVSRAIKRGLSFAQAMHMLAKRILDDSRTMVPYEYGDLYRSGRIKRIT